MNIDCPQSWSCPSPRRDMSISIIDSRGGSRYINSHMLVFGKLLELQHNELNEMLIDAISCSGKVIVFGGFGGGLIDDYLEGSGMGNLESGRRDSENCTFPCHLVEVRKCPLHNSN